MTKRKTGRRENRTGAIFKDGDGYRARILLRHDEDTGKAIYKKVRTKTQAEAIDALARLQHSARTHTLAAPSSLTLGGFLEDWLEKQIKVSRAPQTYRQYRWVLTKHVIPALGKKHIEHVTRRDVQSLVSKLAKQTVSPKFKEQRKKDPKPEYDGKPGPKAKRELTEHTAPTATLSRRTLQSAVAVLHTAYEDAIRDGIATLNPATYINFPQAPTKSVRFLTPDEVAKLNEKLEESQVKELVHFMLATGARLGEATGIRWQDIDIEKRFIRIAGQLQRLDGKLEYRATTKTNQDRTLTIPQWLADELRDMKSRQLLSNHKDPAGVAFLNVHGRRFDPRVVNKELAEVCASAEVPIVSAHKLRHTAATLALMETGDLHGVQKLLGHQQVGLTSNLYGHATAERLRPITDALGKVVRPNSNG